MTRCGASASWRKKIFSPGMPAIASRSLPTERMWKESRHVPSAGWSPAAAIRQAWSYSLTWRPQASAS